MSMMDTFLSEEELAEGITKISLRGRIDAIGAEAIDLRMNLIAGTRKRVLIDLQDVEYIASLGLRSILVPARTILARGGKVAVVGPRKFVAEVLSISGVDRVLPVYGDFATAVAELQAR